MATALDRELGSDCLILATSKGKIRHIGLSDVTVEQIKEAEQIAPIASGQNPYNLSDRQHDLVVDHTAERGIAFVPFFPLAMGVHAGPSGAVARVAREIGATAAQTALAWLLHRAPNIVPIPGARQPTWIGENATALRTHRRAVRPSFRPGTGRAMNTAVTPKVIEVRAPRTMPHRYDILGRWPLYRKRAASANSATGHEVTLAY
ncbi:aldo/keto reductase [Nocardia sp. NPDC052112]|uniref:aldo/keto reductase n=1 Tax=Nocardia sp. NPDC052112 TaxID=3155646 RepID=UPI0034307486